MIKRCRDKEDFGILIAVITAINDSKYAIQSLETKVYSIQPFTKIATRKFHSFIHSYATKIWELKPKNNV
jgi:hypothetical protein